jgi:hypothetical protein
MLQIEKLTIMQVIHKKLNHFQNLKQEIYIS